MPAGPDAQPIRKAPMSSTTDPFSSTSRRSSGRASGSGPFAARPASHRPVRIAGVSMIASTATIWPDQIRPDAVRNSEPATNVTTEIEP